MRVAYFDTIAGVSGDMTLGAFVSAGLPLDELTSEISKLGLPGIELHGSRVLRNGIAAVKIDVIASADQPHRHLRDIDMLIDRSLLSDRTKQTAKAIFLQLARAEATVHDSTIEKIHFHEVGAADSIVDIVGAAICIERFGIEAVYSSPVRLGSGGIVRTAHGDLPLPGPATVEILKGYPTVLTGIPYELTTPTGAAIIKSLSVGTLSEETLSVEHVGYGAGSRELAQVPNILRVLIGDLLPINQRDDVVVVETNIDDMNPEIYPFVIEQLLEHGAHDAYIVPIVMKKGRPGVLLTALASPDALDRIARVIFEQTTTIGVRIQRADRKKLVRAERTVQSTFGPVRVKVAVQGGRERLTPEFEECKRIALERRIPLVDVYKRLERELS